MIENRPLLTVFAHAVLILGVALIAFPIWVTFVASTHDAGTMLRSPIPLDFGALKSVLHDGVLLQNGMPKFDKLTDVQVRQIYAYIRAKAREQLGLRQKDNSRPGNVRL